MSVGYIARREGTITSTVPASPIALARAAASCKSAATISQPKKLNTRHGPRPRRSQTWSALIVTS